MVDYPGQDRDIPKRIAESLGSRPLVHLIPKMGLADLMAEPLSVSVGGRDYDSLETATTAAEPSDLNAAWEAVKNLSNENILFKRPTNMHIRDDNTSDLAGSLSPIAASIFTDKQGLVNSTNIKEKAETLATTSKHKLGDSANDTSLDLSHEDDSKRIKLSSSILLNQATIGEQYLKDFELLIEPIISDNNDYNNVEVWMPLTNNMHITTERWLSSILVTVNNILSAPTTWPNILATSLKKLLKTLIRNITVVNEEEFLPELEYNTSIKKSCYLSSTIILLVLLLDNTDESNIRLEEHILVPMNFIAKAFESLTDKLESSANAISEEATMLLHAISLIPQYIYKRAYLDEGIVTKITYTFIEVLVNTDTEVPRDAQLQYAWTNIKITSREVIVALFEKAETQREFIMEELLSHFERLPTKRLQKRLTKVDDGVYATNFTLTILLMIEMLNCYKACSPSVSTDWNDIANVQNAIDIATNSQKILVATVDHISESLLSRVLENPSKYRHALENYSQDLIALLMQPKWPAAEELLTSLTKRLLLTFNASQQFSAIVEILCLQILGNIGSAMLDIKLNVQDNESSNIVKIFNYPDLLPSFLNRIDLSIAAANEKIQNQSLPGNYLWHRRLITLIKLKQFAQEPEENTKQFDNAIREQLLQLPNTCPPSTQNSTTSLKEYCSTLHAFELVGLYEPYLKLLVSLLGRDKIKLRSTAIKCMAILASKNPEILSNSNIKTTIEQRLKDSSASVKDAILDLVGIGTSCLQFYQQINANYDDDSILVRKHVLKLNEKIYAISTDSQVKAYVGSKILMKIEDEEELIIDQARSILLNKWIFSIPSAQDQPEKQIELCKAVLEIISNIIALNEKCNELFEWYLNFYLLNQQVQDKQNYQIITNTLQKLTDTLVYEIVQLHSDDSKSEHIMQTKNNYLNLLRKFTDSTISFMTKDHIVALYPYLVADMKSDFQYHLLSVFKNTMAKLDGFKPKFLYELETVLLSNLPKMSVRELEEAMPLIWTIAIQRQDTGRISKACSSCFKQLSPYISLANKCAQEIKADGKLQRLVYLATGFARFCDKQKMPENISFLQKEEPIFEYVAKCLLVLSHENIDHIIRRIAIKNLTMLCGSKPKLFNSKHIINLLDNEFKGSKLDIKLVILESLYDFFLSQERISIRKVGANITTSSISQHTRKDRLQKNAYKVELASDGICSALAARFLKYILAICLTADVKSSLIAVRLLKSILEYGYTNPSHCIPTVIGLVASRSQYMRHISMEILNDLFEKYESMVFSTLSQGIKIAIEYSRILQGEKSYFNDLFLKSIQATLGQGKSNSSKFLKTVSKTLTSNVNENIMTGTCNNETKELLIFLLSNIAQLKFSNMYDLTSMVRTLEISSEQLRESITDELQSEEIKMEPEALQNSVIVQVCLQRTTNCIIQNYGMKSDTLLEDLSPLDNSLKNKQAPTPKNSSFSVTGILEKTIRECSATDLAGRYLAIMGET